MFPECAVETPCTASGNHHVVFDDKGFVKMSLDVLLDHQELPGRRVGRVTRDMCTREAFDRLSAPPSETAPPANTGH